MKTIACDNCKSEIKEGDTLYKVQAYEIVSGIPDQLDTGERKCFCSVDCLTNRLGEKE